MHTTQVNDTTFLHNGDYSGDVRIVAQVDSEYWMDVRLDDGMFKEFEVGTLGSDMRVTVAIPFEDLRGFMAEYIRNWRISRAEQLDVDDIIPPNQHGPNVHSLGCKCTAVPAMQCDHCGRLVCTDCGRLVP